MANLRRAFERRLDKKQDALPAMPGILGDPSGRVQTSIPNVVYVQVAQTVTTAICTTVPHIAGLPVWVGYAPHMPDKLQVISQRIIGGAGTDETQAGVTRHAASHEWDGVGAIGGTDIIKVHLQQFMPLRVFPYSGLTIAVYPGVVYGATGWMTVGDANVFGMPIPSTMDLTFDAPTTADKSRYVLITINTSGALVKTLGAEVDSTALTLSDIPAAPAGTLKQLAAVRLFFGQTELVENRNGTDIIDLRWPGISAGSDTNAIHVDVIGEIAAITEKTTPVDADVALIEDSAAANAKKKLSWANIKATLKTYFDTLYAATAKGVTNGDAHDHSGGDGAQINHTTLSNIGTNTHAQIDTHLGSTANPHSVTKAQVGLGDVANILDKLDATSAPTANDDSGDGYAVGSVWVDVTADKAYICVDAALTAAVWKEAGGTGGSITVEEIDGVPSVAGVSKIKVTNGTLTDNTGGTVTLDFGSAATDGAAIHDNTASEIHAITEKTTLADNDEFLIEDSADSYNKKRVKKSNLGVGDHDHTGVYAPYVLNKLDATTAPTADDDSGDGYAINSVWIDVTNDKAYICVDATATAAVWVEYGGAGGGGTTLDGWQDWTPTVTQSGAVSNTVLYAKYLVMGPITFFTAAIDITGSGTGGNAIVIGGQPADLQTPDYGQDIYKAPIGQVYWHNGGSWGRWFRLYPYTAMGWRFTEWDEYRDAGIAPSDALSGADFLTFSGFVRTKNANVLGGGVVDVGLCNGRLTLETGVPVSTTNQTAKTTLYFTPYKGNRISLYDGSSVWRTLTFTELSLDISGYTADKNYDIWAYNNSGTVALDSTVWTNDTTRATALAMQDGVYVKTGATTRRYLGTIRITATTGQCEDSVTKRYVWNYYNRVRKEFTKTSTASHSYNTAAFRAWNNDSSLKVEYVCGLDEDMWMLSTYRNNIAGATYSIVGIGHNTVGGASKTYSAGLGRGNAGFQQRPIVGYGYFILCEYAGENSTFAEGGINGAALG